MQELTIIKIGGKVIDDEMSLDLFLKDFARVEGNKMLVHGGGKVASTFGKRLNIAPKLVDGRRITDKATLDLVTMVYGGLLNRQITAKLQAINADAIGLTGADANVLAAQKRPVKNLDYGFVGDPGLNDVNVERLKQFLDAGLIPVLCALTHDRKGNLLNTNADTIAATLASALSRVFKVKLIYCFEQKGVMANLEKDTIIEAIDANAYQHLKAEQIITEGMIPKMDNAFDALRAGVGAVRIGHFTRLKALVENQEGTLIKP